MELRIGILSVSDRASRGEYEDRGGPAVEQALAGSGWTVVRRQVIPDEGAEIEGHLMDWTDDGLVDVILTTGGTGLGPRDVTPEATLAVHDRLVPGIAEAIRSRSLQITPHAMLSRGTAVLRKGTLIVNLPGSPKGAAEAVEVIRPVLEHAVATMRGAGH